jgi:hypothetical protein
LAGVRGHHCLHSTPSRKNRKEAAMAISLLLMALQDAWLNIGKAAAQIPPQADAENS